MIIEQIFSLWVAADLEPSNYRHSLFRNLSSEDDLLQVGCGPKKSPPKNGQSWSHVSSAFIGWYFLQLDRWIFSKWKIYLFYTLFRVKRLETNVKRLAILPKKMCQPEKIEDWIFWSKKVHSWHCWKHLKHLQKRYCSLKHKNDGCQQESPFFLGGGVFFRCKILVSGRNLCSSPRFNSSGSSATQSIFWALDVMNPHGEDPAFWSSGAKILRNDPVEV